MSKPSFPNPAGRRPDRASLVAAATVAGLCLAALVFLAAYPVMHADLSGDDFGFAAMGRHLSNPLWLYASDHSLSYFYRPHGLVAWWLSIRAFGLDAGAHYALNLTLHAVNAWWIFSIARESRVPSRVAWPLAAMFAVHPATLGAAYWLADRFDLLATAGALGCLWFAMRALHGGSGRLGVLLFALLAAGSKETSLCVLPALAALCVFDRGPRGTWWRVALLSIAAVPFAAMLVVRSLVLSDAGTAIAAGAVLPLVLDGFAAWAKTAPAMLVRNTDAAYATAGAVALVALVLAGLVLAVRCRPSRRSGLAIAALALALAPGFVQAPVTKLVFVDVAHFANPVNGRFYYLAFAGLALVVAALAARPETRDHLFGERAGRGKRWWPTALGALLAGLAVPAALASHRTAIDWATGTRALATVVDAARAAIATLPPTTPTADCQVRLLAAPLAGDFAGFADVAVKAGLPRGDSRYDCVVRTETGPYFASVSALRCIAGVPPNLERRLPALVLKPHLVSSGLCTVFPDTESSAPVTATFRWSDERRAFVRE